LNTPAYFAIDQAIVWVAGLKQFNGISARIYPNPAKDRVFVQAEYPVVSLCLRDLQGREVASSSEAEMSLLGITKGIYYLTIKTSGGNATAKLIVE
jgi:hypothetical protein